eukprot:918944_1
MTTSQGSDNYVSLRSRSFRDSSSSPVNFNHQISAQPRPRSQTRCLHFCRLLLPSDHGAVESIILPACCGILVRVPFVVLLGVVLFLLSQSFCNNIFNGGDREIYAYVVGAFVTHFLTFALQVSIIVRGTSLRGRRIPSTLLRLANAVFVLQLCEIVFMLLGTIVVFIEQNGCIRDDALRFALVAVVLFSNWLTVLASICIRACSVGSGVSQIAIGGNWRVTCRRLFCWPLWKNRTHQNVGDDDFDMIASNFDQIIGDFKLVPSELALGLVLVHYFQRCELYLGKRFRRPYSDVVEVETEKAPSPSHPKFSEKPSLAENEKMLSASQVKIDVSDWGDPAELAQKGVQPDLSPDQWRRLAQLQYFSKFAMGSYGLPNRLFYDPSYCWCPGCLCVPMGLDEERVVGSNMCCHASMKVFLNMTGLGGEDILHASFLGGISHVTYFVAADYKTSSVVVAIRGTESIPDVVTDANAIAEQIDPERLEGIPGEHYSHKGILDASYRITDEIMNNDVIQSFLANHSNWSIVFIGHSLGAGAAVISSVLTRCALGIHDTSRTVRCFGLGTPLCLSEDLAQSPIVREMVTGISNCNDMVTRASIPTFQRLKTSMVVLMDACERSNWSVVVRAHQMQSHRTRAERDSARFVMDEEKFHQTSSRLELVDKELSEFLRIFSTAEPSETSESDITEVVRARLASFNSRIDALISDEQTSTPRTREQFHPMCAAGMVFHTVRHQNAFRTSRIWKTVEFSDEYAIYEADPDIFQEMLSSRTMFTDHMPMLYFEVCKKLEIPTSFLIQ